MITDVTQVRRWLARLDPASEEHPPIAIVRSIARLATPDRAAAVREVETLLRRVESVHGAAAESTPFRLAGGQMDNDRLVTRAELAALVVDRVLGDGGGEAND